MEGTGAEPAAAPPPRPPRPPALPARDGDGPDGARRSRRAAVAVVATVLVVASLAVVVVGSFLAWVRVGRRRRSSYELFGVAERLGYAPGGPAGVALRLWVVVPFLAAVALALVALGRRRIGGALALVIGAYATTLGVLISRAPLPMQPGVAVVVSGGIITALSGGALAVGAGPMRRKADEG